jgi:hypothetical protein
LQPNEPSDVALKTGSCSYTLEDLAYARSGDKGDSCNIGVIARHLSYLPYLRHLLTEDRVADYFAHFLQVSILNIKLSSGLPDFSWSKHTKTGNTYIPNDHKLYQTAEKYSKLS